MKATIDDASRYGSYSHFEVGPRGFYQELLLNPQSILRTNKVRMHTMSEEWTVCTARHTIWGFEPRGIREENVRISGLILVRGWPEPWIATV